MLIVHFCFFTFIFSCYGDHRDLHVLTHSFPTRRSSDLTPTLRKACAPAGNAGGWWTRWTVPRSSFLAVRNSPSISRWRSEEHTSELQSLMRISYAVFCLKKKK